MPRLGIIVYIDTHIEWNSRVYCVALSCIVLLILLIVPIIVQANIYNANVLLNAKSILLKTVVTI